MRQDAPKRGQTARRCNGNAPSPELDPSRPTSNRPHDPKGHEITTRDGRAGGTEPPCAVVFQRNGLLRPHVLYYIYKPFRTESQASIIQPCVWLDHPTYLETPTKSSNRPSIRNRDEPKTSAEWGSQTLRQACSRGKPESAMCVQNFDDSRGLAIRITYRISLRSSSLWEPRHPPLKVVRQIRFSKEADVTKSNVRSPLLL